MASTIPQPMAPTTANWHWKNKNVTKWGHDYFKRELGTISVSDGGQTVEVLEVTDVDGDVELGQRKSKYVRRVPVLRSRA